MHSLECGKLPGYHTNATIVFDVPMKLSEKLTEGRFIHRPNRFASLVRLDSDGREVMTHVANSGRMKELLQEGNRVLLVPMNGTGRKTAFDLALVDVDGMLVSADARLPTGLVAEAIGKGILAPFQDCAVLRREVVFGESRLDLLLKGPRGLCYVEVKSVTLVDDGTALFPDAPTSRGRKHVGSLVKALADGHHAAIVFVIQREDANRFRPNDEADPEFGRALRDATRAGVEVHAYRCSVTREAVEITSPIQVLL